MKQIKLKGSQRKYLRGLAHHLKPGAFVGQKGITESFLNEVNQGLAANELIKVKFVEYKEKKAKTALSLDIEARTESILVGIIGHIAIYYKEHADPEKRSIVIPKK